MASACPGNTAPIRRSGRRGGVNRPTSLGALLVGLAALAAAVAPLPANATTATGDTAPDTPSCHGFAVTPTDAPNLPTIVQGQPTGTVFCLAPGVYRIPAPIQPLDGDVLNGSGRSLTTGTVIRGDTVVPDWAAAGGLFQHVGGTVRLYSTNSPCADGGTICHYADWLFEDDLPLQRVLAPCTTANVVAGTFCIDYTTDTMYLFDDPTGHVLSYSTVGQGILDATNVRVQHMAVGWFASGGDVGAAVAAGGFSTVTDLDVLDNHATGINLVGRGAIIQDSHLHQNGQRGAAGSGVDQFFLNNTVDNNNWMGFDANKGAAGAKFTGGTGMTVSGNIVFSNHGNGLWFDSDNIGTVVDDNVSMHNYADSSGGGDGIRIEKSCFMTITRNTLSDNDRAGLGATNAHDLTIGSVGAGNRVINNGSFAVRLSANGYDRPVMPNCHPDGGVYPITNNVVEGNLFRLSAGTNVGIWGVTGVPTDGSTYLQNVYHLGKAACTVPSWMWWDGTQRVLVDFATWQNTWLQDGQSICKGRPSG